MTSSLLNHVAFVVRSIEPAAARLTELGLAAEPVREFLREGTREQYFGLAEQLGRVLLMEPIDEGPYQAALQSRGPGLHHVALHVDDLARFIDDVVVGSGWLVHPRSFATQRSSSTVWLTRPNVEALVEVHQGARVMADPIVDRITIAGLDLKPTLADIFEGCGIDVVPGPASAVEITGESIFAPGEELTSVDDPFEYNRDAWNRNVRQGNRWTVPVTTEEVERGRGGDVDVLLTPTKSVPPEWLGELGGRDVLCLASGGGQQGPLLAAAGAQVTVFDASEAQLQRDGEVAARDNLDLRLEHGDMRDLSRFDDASFDLIFHPCSNSFVAEIGPVWREAHRVLRPGGELLAGFSKAVLHCFDWGSIERGTPRLRFRLPYRDLDHLDVPWVARMVANGEPIEFGHPLSDQVGGQLDAGFVLIGLYEDHWGNDALFPDEYFDAFVATRARKPPAT